MVTVEPVDVLVAMMLLGISAGAAGFAAGVLWCELRQIDGCGPVEGVPDDND